MKDIYDARARNLGTVPDDQGKVWRRRLIGAGLVVLGVATLVLIRIIWWYATHVEAMGAVVRARVINLSAEVDARMLELRVQPADTVKKKQLLARLDDSAQRATLAAAEAEKTIKESLFNQAKANAQLTELSVETDIALARTRRDIAAARVASTEASLALLRGKAPEEVRRAQAQRDEAQARLRQMQKGLRQETIDAAKARMETAKARAALSQLQVKQTEELVQRNVESPLTLEVRRTELIARQNEVLEAQLTLATLEAGAVDEQIEAAKQTVLAREAALGVAQSDLKEIDVIASDLSIRRAELNQAEIELKRAEDRRVQAVLAREQVKVAEAELKKAEADIEGRQAVIRGMAFFSPVDGIVLRTFEHEGEVCRKGVPTILVADVSTGWWIEGFITEYDASRVRPGQKARVELVIGSGDYVNAVVEAVGLSTTAINRDGNGGRSLAAESRDMVWVKLQPVNTNRQPIPGTSAEVVIRVR